jgi:hypothetical protein
MAACPAWNRSRLESNQSRTWLTRKSIDPLIYDASFDVQSESGMDCRGVCLLQDPRKIARCISTSAGEICSRSEIAKRAGVSSLFMTVFVSKF